MTNRLAALALSLNTGIAIGAEQWNPPSSGTNSLQALSFVISLRALGSIDGLPSNAQDRVETGTLVPTTETYPYKQGFIIRQTNYIYRIMVRRDDSNGLWRVTTISKFNERETVELPIPSVGAQDEANRKMAVIKNESP